MNYLTKIAAAGSLVLMFATTSFAGTVNCEGCTTDDRFAYAAALKVLLGKSTMEMIDGVSVLMTNELGDQGWFFVTHPPRSMSLSFGHTFFQGEFKLPNTAILAVTGQLQLADGSTPRSAVTRSYMVAMLQSVNTEYLLKEVAKTAAEIRTQNYFAGSAFQDQGYGYHRDFSMGTYGYYDLPFYRVQGSYIRRVRFTCTTRNTPASCL
jgi:hypothetical protein